MTPRVLLSAQALLLCIVLFGDIGFDRPGRFGLHFSHLIIIVLVYLCTLITGCVYAVKRGKRALVVAQALLPIVALLYSLRPLPSYDSADYQYLVSTPMDEIEATPIRVATDQPNRAGYDAQDAEAQAGRRPFPRHRRTVRSRKRPH